MADRRRRRRHVAARGRLACRCVLSCFTNKAFHGSEWRTRESDRPMVAAVLRANKSPVMMMAASVSVA